MDTVQIDTYKIIDGQGKEIEVALMDVFEHEGKQYAAVSEMIDQEIQDDVYLYRCFGSGMDMVFEEIEDDLEFETIVRVYMSFYGFE
ncbi:MAG: DUF1292 domain-containing protein [Floccifex sp.]